jgi:hypothetical protein
MEINKVKLPKGKGKAYIIDNVFSYERLRFLYQGLLKGPFNYTQFSEPYSSIPNIRFSHHLSLEEDREVYDALFQTMKKILKKFKLHKKFFPSEIYTNIADAMTTTLPHADRPKECWTLLFYPNIEWDIRWGGQTNFIDEDTMDIMASVIPKPGRFILFKSDILHQATPPNFYCPYKRLTVAFKMDPIEELSPEEMALSNKTIKEYEEAEYVTTNTCWN